MLSELFPQDFFPPYLESFYLWRDLVPIPIFAALVSYLLIRFSGESEENRKKAFMIIFAIALLGITGGQLTGQSREPAVNATVPAVLAFIGGIVVYLIAAKDVQQQALVSLIIVAFSLNFLVGSFWGTKLRTYSDAYRQTESYRAGQEYIEYSIQFEKLYYESRLRDHRKAFGLPDLGVKVESESEE